jgi:hypothetical protein
MLFANTAYTGPRHTPPAPLYDYKKLCYENHPGVDYRVDNDTNTPVLAAISGTVFYPSSMIGLKSPAPYHVLGIKPDGADYVIYYLHLSTYKDTSPPESIAKLLSDLGLPPQPTSCPSTLPITNGTTVAAGCVIGRAGGWGLGGPTAFGVHLHFEVHKIIPSSQAPVKSPYSSFPLCPTNLPGVNPATSVACIPVDPYGWDGPVGQDPYTDLTKSANGPGIRNVRLWNHLPVTFGIFPDNVKASPSATVTLSGDGFEPDSTVVAVEGTTLHAVKGIASSISTPQQATATFACSSTVEYYYLYVLTHDGRHSNWQLLDCRSPVFTQPF